MAFRSEPNCGPNGRILQFWSHLTKVYLSKSKILVHLLRKVTYGGYLEMFKCQSHSIEEFKWALGDGLEAEDLS